MGTVPSKKQSIIRDMGKRQFRSFTHFCKKTQKTPKEEIEKAQRELLDLKKRGIDNE